MIKLSIVMELMKLVKNIFIEKYSKIMKVKHILQS